MYKDSQLLNGPDIAGFQLVRKSKGMTSFTTATVTDDSVTQSWTASLAVGVDKVVPVGRSFTKALRDKYCSTEEDVCHNSFVIALVIRGKPMDPSKGQAELGFLRNVVLSDNNISHAGIPGPGLQSLCPNVVDLDLSNNLMDNWKEVLAIWMGLPHLKYVNLTRNSLRDHEGVLEENALKLPAIENLVLNQTDVEWKDVTLLCQHLSSLHELHLCGNGYREIPTKVVKHWSNIHCLRLNNNLLTSWNEVWKLKKLDNLSSLILSGNPVTDVFYYDETLKTDDKCVDFSGQSHSVRSETGFISRETSDTTKVAGHTLGMSTDAQIQTGSAGNGEPVVSGSNKRGNDCGLISEAETALVQPKPVRYIGDSTAVCQNMINEIMENVCPRRSSSPSASCTPPAASLPAGPSPAPCENMEVRSDNNINSGETDIKNLQVITKQPQVFPTLDMEDNSAQPWVPGSEDSSNPGVPRYKTTPAKNEQLLIPSVNTDTKSDTDVVTEQQKASCSSASEEPKGNLKGQSEAKVKAGSSTVKTGESHCSFTKIVPFAGLESLCLSNTEVSSYQHLHGLSKFPKLKSLRITNTKVFGPMLPDEKRKMLVACLPNVTVLNGSEVSDTEREKGEKYFLRHFRDNAERPPQYAHLEEKHGRLDDVPHIDISRGFCQWAEVIFVLNNAKLQTSTIHVVNPVGTLRTYIAEQVLNIPRRSFKMYHYACGPCHEEEEDTAFNELFLDSLPMSRYNLMHGDEIHIEISEAGAKKQKIVASYMTSQRD